MQTARPACSSRPVGTTTQPPKWIKPQLTRLVAEAPAGPGWLHEIKYDGYRMHARIDGGQPTAAGVVPGAAGGQTGRASRPRHFASATPRITTRIPERSPVPSHWSVLKGRMAQSKESLLAQADSLHDLARRARRLSQNLSQEPDQQRLVRYAEELDDSAARLEKEAASAKTMTLKPLPDRDSG